MKKLYLVVLCCLVVVALITIGSTTPFFGLANPSESIKIGAIFPLSGDMAYIGKSNLNAFNLALEDFKKENDLSVDLIIEDSQMSSSVAATAVNKLIYIDGVDVVVTNLAPIVSAVTPITSKEQIVTFLTSVVSSSFAIDYNFTYKYYPDVIDFADVIIGDLNKKNITSVGLMIYNLEPGDGFIAAFEENYAGKMLSVERFDISTKEFKSNVLKNKDLNVGAYIFIGWPQSEAEVLNEMLQLGYKIPTYFMLANYPVVNTGAKDALKYVAPISTWYTFSENNSKEFVNHYYEKYGEKPDAEAAYSYDTMSIILQVISECGKDKNCIDEKMTSTAFNTLIDPKLRFDKYGNAILPSALIQYDASIMAWKTIG